MINHATRKAEYIALYGMILILLTATKILDISTKLFIQSASELVATTYMRNFVFSIKQNKLSYSHSIQSNIADFTRS